MDCVFQHGAHLAYTLETGYAMSENTVKMLLCLQLNSYDVLVPIPSYFCNLGYFCAPVQGL